MYRLPIKTTMLPSAFKFLALSLLIILSFGIVACGASGGRPLKELLPTPDQKSEYTVNRGDTLNIQVWGEPRVSGEVLVRNDGKLTLPLVNDVDASGKTLQSLTDEIATRLSEFITAASVSISVSQRAPTAYYLSGSFQKPGEYRSDKNIKLLQAIATGGGFAPFAEESNITLIRPNPTGNGDLRYQLNYQKIVSGSQPNPVLRDGDTITVK